ncbi:MULTISPECIES: 23S rRNA (guanosine(2251)-2'-O)-methyltransferase RlmB [unclassified Frondihabitans]|uniref:23S rRNA (guanosine(2251)-2'-O)-methyltransferase RlmB n=1 Tax=unclassified Frondihabitans TaxID=2626248 RepID=UPI000F4E524A|nr:MULTISPECIES: 23S rRNA (guanosine(2251)-2'-O)-methyltransferase RlmB [unclassified Frondihabitans]RPE73433.1 23S rRNA (guanosine2251-2'-O)-methyltransferase [Frondihabitans sp. PhB153]RPF01531.1 23S rRNA (guanosine2251-2'-O)-methyltransferase [Frondihabitans sp. PhB161]
MKNTQGERKGRPGAVRQGGKGKQVGSGGQGRQALEGKKPTPRAEDRPYHPAGKRKAAQDRLVAAKGRAGSSAERPIRTARTAPDRTAPPRGKKQADDNEIVTGRNSVLEALRARIPATTLYIAARLEMDDRVKEVLTLATRRGIPVLEVMRPELDRLTGPDSVHQGLALKVPPYEYAHPMELLDQAERRGQKPLFVALDGITDPRNLGAIIRSVAAFGGQAVIVPQRRSVGVTASAWKTSAGAASRVPVAMAANLTQTLKAFKDRGVFVLGLDGGGDVQLPGLDLADQPLVIVVGSEGKGLSRIVTEACDAIVSVPITASTESLNAGIAASVTLYEISKLRAERKNQK